MTNLDDRALALVLHGAPLPSGDAELADAVTRARHDVDRIRRGIALVADTPMPVVTHPTRRPWLLGAAAAAVLALGIAGLAIASNDRVRPVAATSTTAVPGPATASARPGPALTLRERVEKADRIVIGVITDVERGELEPDGASMPYVLTTIAVEETIKGEPSDEVVAFDYDFAGIITSSDAPAVPWNVGEEVLLFLVSDAGTVSEHLEPAHLQVADGARGRYAVFEGEVVGEFTLDDVRAATAR